MPSHYAFIFCGNTWHKLSVDVKISISSAKLRKIVTKNCYDFPGVSLLGLCEKKFRSEKAQVNRRQAPKLLGTASDVSQCHKWCIGSVYFAHGLYCCD